MDVSYLYQTERWKLFRLDVLNRDDFECQECGSKENLQVHHLKRAEKYPEKFFDLDNCVTLCKKHHEEVHDEAKSFIEANDYNDSLYGVTLCDCGRFYHDTKYRMCYECYLEWKRERDIY